MTFNDVKEAEQKYKDAKREYSLSVYDFLAQCLVDAGMSNKTVRVKKDGKIGVLRVEESSYGCPFEIKFYPLKKDGGVSQMSRGVYDLYISHLFSEKAVAHLKAVFEVVEDYEG